MQFVSDREFDMYKKIAISLHNQTFFDDTKKQYRPILQTTEPAEVLRFAIDGFVEKVTNPKYHHVILRLDQPASLPEMVNLCSQFITQSYQRFFYRTTNSSSRVTIVIWTCIRGYKHIFTNYRTVKDVQRNENGIIMTQPQIIKIFNNMAV